jgi:RNA polymerase sigma factor (sigma-70 family)
LEDKGRTVRTDSAVFLITYLQNETFEPLLVRNTITWFRKKSDAPSICHWENKRYPCFFVTCEQHFRLSRHIGFAEETLSPSGFLALDQKLRRMVVAKGGIQTERYDRNHFQEGGSKKNLEHFFENHERAMLIRYCTHFTHDWSLAEDLVQQALLEAWLKLDHLYAPDRRTGFLIGVARNVSLRWVRSQSLEKAHLSDLPSEAEAIFVDDGGLEEHFERQELTQFVEKALALLPPQTRTVLVQYYLEALPQAGVAARLRITAGAVEARLRRARRTLLHLLTHELREEAESLGLVNPERTSWQHTHIWCPMCGQRQLTVRLPEPPGTLAFRCPGCSNGYPQEIGWGYPLSNAHFVQLRASLTQPKSILRRFSSWAYDYYSDAISHKGAVACAGCGKLRRLRLLLPVDGAWFTSDHAARYGFSGQCPSCGWQDFCSPEGLLQSLPIVQRFWQAHPRMHLVFGGPIEEVEGSKALVVSFESLTDAAHLDIVIARDTLQLMNCTGI